MIKIGIIGDIGAGKSHISKMFGYPVFNADHEVIKIYKSSKSCYRKIKKIFPKHFFSFPIKKSQIMNVIFENGSNLKKITKIIHPEVNNRMKKFIKKNKNKKLIILDVPLLLENKINKKDDILVFIESNKKETYKRLKKRKNFNFKLFKKFKKIQLPLEIKKKKSTYKLKNNFTNKFLKKDIKILLGEILRK
jgi:dephospho-CoA kinase